MKIGEVLNKCSGLGKFSINVVDQRNTQYILWIGDILNKCCALGNKIIVISIQIVACKLSMPCSENL